MTDTSQTSWVEELEVTGPIKSIMGFVDELSLNYDRRIDAMHADYQKDIEEMIVCYKAEKQEFETQIFNSQKIIDNLQKDLAAVQQNFKRLSVEYKICKDCLATSKQDLAALTNELKKEDDLIALATERIRAANAQIKDNLKTKTETETSCDSPKPAKSSKTKEFFKLVMEARLSRAKVEDNKLLEDQQKDSFSY